MKIHEYQAKNLMARFGIPVPLGDAVSTVEEGMRLAREMWCPENPRLFVKAQVHAGGRGKAGGVIGCDTLADVEKALGKMLGMKLVTHQTGPEGRIVRKVMIVQGCLDVERELYVGMVLDRQKEQPVMMASTQGGMEIESVAATHPELIIKEYIHPLAGMSAYQARRITLGLGLKGNHFQDASRLFLNVYRMFIELDASQVEINPLAVTRTGRVIALDAKINFDESALYRHPEIVELRDLNEESPLEVEASQYGLNYIKLDGNIGCMVNGAGLAMATMDLIKYYGASPANFLDVGGGADEESITAAFTILLADPDVRAVLVNIFGGIVRCDRVARGIIHAVHHVGMNRPLVVRLNGTNADIANQLLVESGLKLEVAGTMAEAAQKVIASVT